MKSALYLFLILFVAGSAKAQENSVQAFSLKEAVDFALKNNTDAKNAALGIDEAKARNLEIISTGLPQISASVDYNYNFKTPLIPSLSKIFSDTSSATSKVFNYMAQNDTNVRNLLYQSALEGKDQKISFLLPHSLSAGLQVSQLVFDARYFFGIKATKDLLKTSHFSKEMSDQEVRYSVIKAYYQAQAAQESKGLLSETLTLVQKLLFDTRKIYEEGLIEELDVNRLELIESNLQSQINLQNQMTEVALSNLKFQMGLPLSNTIILKDNIDELRSSLNLAADYKFDVTQRVEYNLLDVAIRLKGYDIAQKKSYYYPSLVAFLSYGWSAQTEKFTDIFKTTTDYYPDGDTRKRSPWFDQGMVGFSLKIPIFDSGQKLAQVRQAKIEQQKSRNDFEHFKEGADLQFRVAQTTLNSAIADEANTQKSVALSEKIFKKNQIKFKEGVGSSFELVQSEQDYVTNQLKKIQSTMNLLNAKADLDKAMGIK